MKSATAFAVMHSGCVAAALTVSPFRVVRSDTVSTNLITLIPKCSADHQAPLDRSKLWSSPLQTPRIYTHIQLLWQQRFGQHAACHCAASFYFY